MSAASQATSSPDAPRGVAVLFSLAFVSMAAAAVVNAVAVNQGHQGVDDLRRVTGGATPTDFADVTRQSAAIAEQAVSLQAVNLGLLVVAAGLTAAAIALHARRAPSSARWVTVCAWTRRVRWQGRWVSFEDYLAQRFNLRCTHGICDEAAEELRRN